MLAHLERTLPRGESWRYEPKFDGFRGLLWHGDGATTQLLSRNVKDLSAWFRELIEAGKALPSNTLGDGEIAIADDGCLDFGALQARLGMARRDAARVEVAGHGSLVAASAIRPRRRGHRRRHGRPVGYRR